MLLCVRPLMRRCDRSPMSSPNNIQTIRQREFASVFSRPIIVLCDGGRAGWARACVRCDDVSADHQFSTAKFDAGCDGPGHEFADSARHPAFCVSGTLIEMTGTAKSILAFLAFLLGLVHAELSYVLLGTIYLVAGICGLKAADLAAVTPVLFPEMKKHGLDDSEMASLRTTAVAMSETVPPSIVLNAVGSATGVPIAALFASGLLPAAVPALALVARAHTGCEKPKGTKRSSGRTVGRNFIMTLLVLILPFVIRTAVIENVATAAEVSTIGIVYTVPVELLIYRLFDWRLVYPILLDTALPLGAILFIIGAASDMGWALTQSGFCADLAAAMEAAGGAVGFMVISIAAFAYWGEYWRVFPSSFCSAHCSPHRPGGMDQSSALCQHRYGDEKNLALHGCPEVWINTGCYNSSAFRRFYREKMI